MGKTNPLIEYVRNLIERATPSSEDETLDRISELAVSPELHQVTYSLYLTGPIPLLTQEPVRSTYRKEPNPT